MNVRGGSYQRYTPGRAADNSAAGGVAGNGGNHMPLQPRGMLLFFLVLHIDYHVLEICFVFVKICSSEACLRLKVGLCLFSLDLKML